MSTKPVVVAATGFAALVAVLPIAIGVSISAPLESDGGSPGIAMAAYERAAAAMADESPACSVPAWLLAGIGEIESGHGTAGGAKVTMDGSVSPAIVGPAVPGLADSDRGRWDGLRDEDRAVGPMQILPSTWAMVGRDGNGDGVGDPHNLFDAALSAAVYLCRAAGPMATKADWRRGLLAYNHSTAYVDAVLAAGQRYRDPGTLARGLVDVPGIGLTSASWAERARSMLAAAQHDGITLTGHSYRDRAAQVLLRQAHCGTSHYAVYDMPASACYPPTARPGTSLHERGLAIDFDDCSMGSQCFRWLQGHAASYGVFNLPSEPWHWSSNGK